MVAKKDWREAKKKYEEQEKQKEGKSPRPSNEDSSGASDDNDPDSGAYQQDMDEMRCILYCHGGVCFMPLSSEHTLIKLHRRLLLW